MARIVIVGSGHNGLTCAISLALAGHKVSILEQARWVGGACTTEQWASGARVSSAANHYGMYPRQLLDELGVSEDKLCIKRAEPNLIVGLGEGVSVATYSDAARTSQEIRRFSRVDGDAVHAYFEDLSLASSVLGAHLSNRECSLASLEAALESARAGLGHRFLHASIAETIAHYFHGEEARAAFAAASFLYNASPQASGSAFCLTYLSLAQVGGFAGWGIPRFGMGALSEALHQRAVSLGVEVRCQAKVVAINTNGQKATGVTLEDGSFVEADLVASNADPFTTYVKLLGQRAEDYPIWNDERFYGHCAKFNFTFEDELISPWCLGQDHKGMLGRSALVYLPSLEFAEMAFSSARTNPFSTEPYFEFVCPTDFWPSRGPRVGSIYLLFVNYRALTELSPAAREEEKSRAFSSVLAMLGIRQVAERELLDPIDLEKKFGFHHGNVDHGAMVPENLFEMRGKCATPIERLVLCGAGAQPGGLVSGLPGRRAARMILSELG